MEKKQAHPAVVLASQSPRRKELLGRIVPEFTACPSGFAEREVSDPRPERLARRLAEGKAAEVAKHCPQAVVIGCDTVVVSPDGEVFGIPGDREEAARMLRALSGRTHRVISGVCVLREGKRSVFHKTTRVTFCRLSEEEIGAYLDTGEPFDKAGGYGIQGYAGGFVEKINGDYYNVVGLPLCALRRVLRGFGVPGGGAAG